VELNTRNEFEDSNVLTSVTGNRKIDSTDITTSIDIISAVEGNNNIPSLTSELIDPLESNDSEFKEINSSIKEDESANINDSIRVEKKVTSDLSNNNIISDVEEDDWSFSEAAPVEVHVNSQGNDTSTSFNDLTVDDDDDDWAFSEAPPIENNHKESADIQNKVVDSSSEDNFRTSNVSSSTPIDLTNHSINQFEASFDDDDWTAATTTSSLSTGLVNAIEISYLNSFNNTLTQNQQLEFDRLREISKELFQLGSFTSYTADSKPISPLVIDCKPLTSPNLSEDHIRMIYELALSTIPNDAVTIEEETPVFLDGHISTSLQSTDSLDEDVNEVKTSNKQPDNQLNHPIVSKVSKDIDHRTSVSLDTQIETKKSTVQLFIDKLPDLTYMLQ